MKCLRSDRSTKTPAKGIMMTIGASPMNVAIDKRTALPVVTVIHQMRANWATDEPSREVVCPRKKIK